ncbi:hypothetical protein Tco_0436347 [Tanacetum coccineum]
MTDKYCPQGEITEIRKLSRGPKFNGKRCSSIHERFKRFEPDISADPRRWMRLLEWHNALSTGSEIVLRGKGNLTEQEEG